MQGAVLCQPNLGALAKIRHGGETELKDNGYLIISSEPSNRVSRFQLKIYLLPLAPSSSFTTRFSHNARHLAVFRLGPLPDNILVLHAILPDYGAIVCNCLSCITNLDLKSIKAILHDGGFQRTLETVSEDFYCLTFLTPNVCQVAVSSYGY
jgi:hypothetical protein